MKSLALVVLIAFSYLATNNAFKLDSRIVDGQNAKIGQFPYYAFLNIRLLENEGAACGASLLSDEWLLTAAHCLRGAESLDVVLGESQLEHFEPGAIAISVGSDGFHVHPDYNPSAALNDIALLQLPTRIEFSDYIQPISLPTTCKAPTNEDVVAVGHGAISDSSDVSMQLNYAFLTTISPKLCEKVFPPLVGRKSVICATSTTQDFQSVCRGDSGGPLVTLSQPTLIGVSCFVRGEGCETGLPQGFTSTFSYLNWIRDVTGIDLPKC